MLAMRQQTGIDYTISADFEKVPTGQTRPGTRYGYQAMDLATTLLRQYPNHQMG